MTARDVARALGEIGLPQGAVVLVHSSLRSLGYVAGGAPAVVEALLAAVGPRGTVMVPTLPFRGSQHAYLRAQPIFDVRRTPSAMGAVSEALRTRPDALRSLHPTHPVAAVGSLAGDLLRHHERAPTCCGLGTPFFRNIAADGYVLLLGVDNRSNTTLHTVEEMEALHYVFSPDTFEATVIDWSDQVRRVPTRAYAPNRPRAFLRVDGPLQEAGVMRVGQVGRATARLMPARGICRVVCELLRRDPDALLPPPGAPA